MRQATIALVSTVKVSVSYDDMELADADQLGCRRTCASACLAQRGDSCRQPAVQLQDILLAGIHAVEAEGVAVLDIHEAWVMGACAQRPKVKLAGVFMRANAARAAAPADEQKF